MSDYSDILNRKTFRDKFSEALNKQADGIGKPMNKGQADTQAILRGFAAGFGNDREREAKLAELEEQYKQADSLERELKMSTGQNQLKKEKYNLFLNENYAGLMQLSDLMQKGEDGKVDILGPELFANFSRIMGEDLGKFQHYKNGYFNFIDKKGQPRTINSMNLLQPLIANLPDDQKQNFKGFLTPLQMKDIDRIYEEKQLKIDKYRAEIDASKAHSNLYEAQAKEVLRKAENPTMTKSQEIVFKSNVDNNQQYIKEARKKVITDKILVQTLNEAEDMIIEAAKKGQVGSDLLSKGKRLWSKYLTGDNKEITIADMAKAAYFARVKEAGGANPSTTEFLTALETIPNTDKNLLAALSVLKKDKNIALNNIYRFNNIEKNLRNNNYQGSPDDENIINFNEEEYNNFVNENSLKKTIRVSKKDKNTGKIITIEVPADDFEKVYNEGFSFKGK